MATWHGLEERKEPGKLTLANCWPSEWDVVPVPLSLPDGRVTPFKTLVCTDKPDVFVGNPFKPSFVPVLNSDFLKMLQDAMGGTGHEMVSAGSIRNRGRVFVSFKLKGMEVFEAAGRKFSAFLNAGNGHDRSSVLWMNTSNGCPVCDNTFTIEMVRVENRDLSGSQTEESDDLSVSQRHTKNIKVKLPEWSKMVDKAIGVQGKFQAEFNRLASIPCGITDAESLFTGFLAGEKAESVSTRTENRVTELVRLFNVGKGNNGETMADAFSAGTDYFSHNSVGDNREKQFLSSEFGASGRAKSELFNVITNDVKRIATMQRGASLLAAN